jgi:hypothetical protein
LGALCEVWKRLFVGLDKALSPEREERTPGTVDTILERSIENLPTRIVVVQTSKETRRPYTTIQAKEET